MTRKTGKVASNELTMQGINRIRRELKKAGVPPSKWPKEVRNRTVARSKHDALGVISVERMGGVRTSKATEVVRRFENNVGGTEEVVSKISALDENDIPKDVQRVVGLIKARPQMSLSRAIAESGASALRLIRTYTEGAIALSQMEAVLEAHKNLPHVVRDIARHALDQLDVCPTCLGDKIVPSRKGTGGDVSKIKTKTCPMCRGEGTKLASSPHKEFAAQKLLEITKVLPKAAPSTTVNVGVKVEGGKGFFEQMVQTSDEILYGTGPKAIDVVAEPVKDVQPKDSSAK